MLILSLFGLASPALSQVAASATVVSDYIYRGFSLSDGRPAVSLILTADDSRGLYGGGSLIAEAGQGRGPELLGQEEYLGYAFRLSNGRSLDLGVHNLNYLSYDYPSSLEDAAEVYIGWVDGLLNGYLHYSPNYFQPGAQTIYAEVNGAIRLPRPWRLFGHVGALTPLRDERNGKELYDVRAGMAAEFRHAEIQVAWTNARPSLEYVSDEVAGRGVVAVTLALFF